MSKLISGGLVSIEDGIKKAEEYAPPRKVRVELRFEVPEGSDEGERFLDGVAALASAKVAELLGVATAPASAPATDTDAAKRAYAEKLSGGTPTPAAKPVKPPKPKAAVAVKPAEKSEPVAAEETIDDFLDDPKPEPAVELTDKFLSDECTKVSKVIGGGTKIRALIETFGPEGKKISLREIPQDKRQEFLDKLSQLKA